MSEDAPGRGDRAGLHDRLMAGAAAVNAPLTAAGAELLLEYLRLLQKWNSRFNLSGITGTEQMLNGHLLDSLSIAPWTSGETVLDAGSGAGLPGIPLAVLFPDKRFVLVDSNGKKARFLFQAKLSLGLENVSVEHRRVEDYSGPADLVVCRALSPLAESAAKTQHILSRGAKLLAMKGRHPGRELAQLQSAFVVEFVNRVHVPGIESRHIVGINFRA